MDVLKQNFTSLLQLVSLKTIEHFYLFFIFLLWRMLYLAMYLTAIIGWASYASFFLLLEREGQESYKLTPLINELFTTSAFLGMKRLIVKFALTGKFDFLLTMRVNYCTASKWVSYKSIEKYSIIIEHSSGTIGDWGKCPPPQFFPGAISYLIQIWWEKVGGGWMGDF